MKCGDFMPKYYSYDGKQVGWVRKKLDTVVLIEEAWVNEVRQHLAKNGYDTLLETIGRVLKSKGHPSITRAQAWVILHDLTNDGVPELLRNESADEEVGKGTLFASIGKSAVVAGATAVDTVANPVGKVVGGAVMGVNAVGKKITGTSEADSDESAE